MTGMSPFMDMSLGACCSFVRTMPVVRILQLESAKFQEHTVGSQFTSACSQLLVLWRTMLCCYAHCKHGDPGSHPF